MRKRRKEFIPVMLMPFKPNGDIDYTGLTALTEFYLEAGAQGLFANCLSSEMYSLTPAERLKATRHVVEVVQHRVPVVATGTFGGAIEQQADFVKAMSDTGIQAVIVITGIMANGEESDAVLANRIEQLLALTDPIPVGFYECPVPYKRVLSAALLQQFMATGRIRYHKDTCLDIEQVKAKLQVATRPDFGLYDAYAVHAVESLKAGAAGLSCIQGNYFPELIVWLCDNFDNATLQSEVQQVQHFLIQHMDIVHRHYPVVAKYFLQKRGLPITTTTREQPEGLTAKMKEDIDQFYRIYQKFQESLEIGVML